MQQEPLGLMLALAKIERRKPLSDKAKQAFLELPHRRKITRKYVDLVSTGERPTESIFLEKGLLNRWKAVRNGGRQIVSLHVPGDMVDLQSLLLEVADHSVGTETDCATLHVPHRHIIALAEAYPEIGRALWFDTLQDAAIYREWTLNIGQRDGAERVAHLVMEMGYRMEQAGLASRTDFSLPMSQADLADATGLTSVHISRVLSRLRSDQMILWDGGQVLIPDWGRAAEMSGFDPLYLEVSGPKP